MDTNGRKLFIGGISWETTEENLKSYFESYGEVVEAVIMKDRDTGRARGFGFVVFADPVVADRVVQDKHSIDGRQVEAKKAVPRDEQQVATRNSNAGLVLVNSARTKKIFVGGLAATMTEHDFRKYFEQFGVIIDVVVMYDHGTQRPRGFGFITYDSDDAVDTVLQAPFHVLKGKMVEVKRAIPKELPPRELSASPVTNFGSGLSSVLRGGGPYGGGYGQLNPSPMGPLGLRMDGRYNPSPGINYSPYGPVGYEANRSPAMNSLYTSPYGGGATNLGRNIGPTGSLNASGIFGGNGSGYGSSPAGSGYGNITPGRNPWSSGAGYGGSSLEGGYRYNPGSSMSGYGGGVGVYDSSQNPASSSGLGAAGISYDARDDLYNSSSMRYGGRASSYWNSYVTGSVNSGGGYREGVYRDVYSSLGNPDMVWKSSAGTTTVNLGSFGAFGGYGPGDKNGVEAMGGYTGGYTSESSDVGHRSIAEAKQGCWRATAN